MRVTLLTQNARAGDAIGRHVAEKAAYFLDRGARVRVVVGDDRGLHPALRPLTMQQSSSPRGAGWDALRAADVLVVDYPQYYALLELLPLLADGRRRIVFDYHGVTPSVGRLANHRDSLQRGRETLGIAGFADAVIPHSQFTEKELLDAIAVPRDRRHRLGYVIDATQFHPGEPVVSLQRRLGLKDAGILLFVGRLAPNKRVPILVKALAELPEVHAVIVGPCGDSYEFERLLCREVAADSGVTDRVHFLGSVDDATLLDCYRSADALVMPSIHEGFCLPVAEAMSCGLPVIAARAGALPETIADAGLTFSADEPSDLARVVMGLTRLGKASSSKIFPGQTTRNELPIKRIAVVTPAFGEAAGGAERSLSLIAHLLHDLGYIVDVLTTRIEGPTPLIPVQVFRAEPADPLRRAAAYDKLDSSDEINESTYFANTLSSLSLVEAIRVGAYDAVIFGPCGNALSRDVLRVAGERAIVVPCLHDEPVARTSTVRRMFDGVGGILYHSHAEQGLAQSTLGFNHPNVSVMGTWIDTAFTCNPTRGRLVAGGDRYLLVCGRKVREKGLAKTIAWARWYDAQQPGRFRFVFAGEGDYPIPCEPWAIDLGRVNEAVKRDLMGGAAALLQLSANESLSLVVLEAQSLGTPVIVNGENSALSRHIHAGRGGWAISSQPEFAQTLDLLWHKPELGVELGGFGRAYVVHEFNDRNRTARVIADVIDNLGRPISELMRFRGLGRAQEFNRDRWRKSLDGILECMFDQPSVVTPTVLEITAPGAEIINARVWRVVLQHRSGLPLVSTGPCRSEVVARVCANDGEPIGKEFATPIPAVLANGQEMTIDVALPPLPAGDYALEAGVRVHHGEDAPITDWHGILSTLTVSTSTTIHTSHAVPRPRFRKSIDAARELQQLPDGYVDVTTGRFARLKKRIKEKLLHNFRASYVDVLARQQSRFNLQVTGVLAELADTPADAEWRTELAATHARCAELADRLERLESATREVTAAMGGGQ